MTKTYVTRYENQTAMNFPIYEGEEKNVKNNHLLGEIMMKNIQPAKAGVGRCDLLMRVDANGIFKVEATMQDDQANHEAIEISLTQNQPKYDVDELITEFAEIF
ncbi:unnamed protein product [Allacma fusca]|uniref:Uncharacterized protein n=1 Tax=Allacma fusca TaxID=39272 RepID=A0A8J2LQM3_9HEXA|nr:unnamed protein product [Allacma fusca]